MAKAPQGYPHPMQCMVIVPGYNVVGLVDRWTAGYTPFPGWPAEKAEAFNQRRGVSPAMRESMLIGSMFGWHVPGADPERCSEYAAAKPLA